MKDLTTCSGCSSGFCGGSSRQVPPRPQQGSGSSPQTRRAEVPEAPIKEDSEGIIEESYGFLGKGVEEDGDDLANIPPHGGGVDLLAEEGVASGGAPDVHG